MNNTVDKAYNERMKAYGKGIALAQSAYRQAAPAIAPRVSDQAQYVRYQKLKEDPDGLEEFVSRGLGTTDSARIQQGVAEYISEMRKRFGE